MVPMIWRDDEDKWVPYISIAERTRAYELWKEYFDKGINPVEYRGFCMFCQADMDGARQEHLPDCIYIQAKELINGQ